MSIQIQLKKPSTFVLWSWIWVAQWRTIKIQINFSFGILSYLIVLWVMKSCTRPMTIYVMYEGAERVQISPRYLGQQEQKPGTVTSY